VCSSLMMICTQLGMHFTHAAPVRYQAPSAWQDIARANAAASGGSVTVTDDVRAAVRQADFIYTDLWWWIGQEKEIPERQRAFMPNFQINGTLLAEAPAHAKFMHCLPASRGVEVTDAIMDGPQSIIYDQSENRLHTEKGLLVYFVYPRLKSPSATLAAFHRGRVEDFLTD
jgi:putrescine carbamoyltransferase